MKRLLLLLFLLSSLYMRGETVTGDAGPDIKWSYDTETGVLTLSGSGDMDHWSQRDLVPWHSYKGNIKKAVIGEGINDIGVLAFYDFKVLEEVVLPSTLIHIKASAFYCNESLEKITLPDNLVTIDFNNFAGCKRLKALHLPSSVSLYDRNIHEGFFDGSDSLKVTVDDANPYYTSDGNALYSKDKTKLLWYYKLAETFTLPSTITEIYAKAFAGGKLKTVDISTSAISFGNNAFEGCKDLTSVSINAEWAKLGNLLFSNCTSLKSATIKAEIDNLSSTFAGCSSLETVVLPEYVGTTSMYSTFNGCKMLDNVTVPDNINKLEYTFYECENLKTVELPKTVTEMIGTFSVCKSLKAINIPTELTRLENAFSSCSSLEKVYFADNMNKLTAIPGAFAGCSSLKDITLPKCVTNIHETFLGCSSLASITLHEGITNMCSAFQGCKALETVNIPSSATNLENAFLDCSSLDIPLKLENATNITRAFMNCKRLKKVDIGIWVESMNTAFLGCDSLTDVTVALATPPALALTTFSDKALQKALLHVPYGSADAYSNAQYWQFANIIEDHEPVKERASGNLGGIKWTLSEDWVLTIASSNWSGKMTSFHEDKAKDTTNDNGRGEDNANSAKYPWYIYREKVKEIYVDKNVEGLGWSCFHGMSALEKITLPFFGLSETSTGLESCFGAIFGRSFVSSKDESWFNPSMGYTVYDYYYTYSFNVPSTLKTVVLTGETANNESFKKYTYDSPNLSKYSTARYYRHESYTAADMANTTFDFVAVKNLVGDFCAYPSHESIRLNYIGETIAQGALAGAAGLSYLKIPGTGATNGSSSYPLYTLFGNTQVEGMTLVNGTYMPSRLEEVVVADGTRQIPEAAFKDLAMVQKITIPSTVISVGNSAFYGCSGMTDLYVNSAFPPVAYAESFTGVSKYYCKLHVPADSKDFYKNDDFWKYFYFIESDANVLMTVKKNIENAGEVTGINRYNNGEQVSFFAAPNAGYRFVEWQNNHGEVLCTENQLSFTATCDSTIVAIFAPLSNLGNVETIVNGQTVKLSWTVEEGATYYTVNIYSDATMKNLVTSLTVNPDGTISKHENLSRSGDNIVEANIEDLVGDSRFFYLVTAYNDEEVVLAQKSGYFSTPATGISDLTTDREQTEITVSEGYLLINGSTAPVFVYSLDGRIVKSDRASSTHKYALSPGLYIVHTGNVTKKVCIK